MPEPLDAATPYTGPTMMTQTWADAAFLHWALEPADVAPMLPPGVHPDVHDGRTYVGLVPFRMLGAGDGGRRRRRGLPRPAHWQR